MKVETDIITSYYSEFHRMSCDTSDDICQTLKPCIIIFCMTSSCGVLYHFDNFQYSVQSEDTDNITR